MSLNFDEESDESDSSEYHPCNWFEISDDTSTDSLFKCPTCVDCCHSLTVTHSLYSDEWDAIALLLSLSRYHLYYRCRR